MLNVTGLNIIKRKGLKTNKDVGCDWVIMKFFKNDIMSAVYSRNITVRVEECIGF